MVRASLHRAGPPALRGGHQRRFLPLMPCFYFDIDDTCTTLVDDDGLDLPDLEAARRLAWELLGEAIMIRADQPPRRIAVDVRDSTGAVLRASAHLDTTAPEVEPGSGPH